MRARLTCLIAILAAALPAAAFAADVEGASDFPLVGRYEGSEIVQYGVSEYDAAAVMTGPVDAYAEGQAGEGWSTVEGRVTLIYYALPAGRSLLEVQRNFEAFIASKGGTVAFRCATADGSCFKDGSTAGTYLGQAVGPALTLPKLSDDYVHNWFGAAGRYTLATFERPEGMTRAQIFLGEGGEHPVAVVRVVESRKMDSDRITVIDAAAMRKAMDETGRVSLYGIHFDTDKDTLKEDSRPTLNEIAALLAADPSLRLLVVGHTDAEGSFDYNLDLSDRRAAAVVAALTGTYGVDPGRLRAFGASAAAPVAPNDSEDGRARNRRVELVRQ